MTEWTDKEAHPQDAPQWMQERAEKLVKRWGLSSAGVHMKHDIIEAMADAGREVALYFAMSPPIFDHPFPNRPWTEAEHKALSHASGKDLDVLAIECGIRRRFMEPDNLLRDAVWRLRHSAGAPRLEENEAPDELAAWDRYNKDNDWGSEAVARGLFIDGFRAAIATPTAPTAAAEPSDELAGGIAYQLTKRMVIDMPTARAAVDAAILALHQGTHASVPAVSEPLLELLQEAGHMLDLIDCAVDSNVVKHRNKLKRRIESALTGGNQGAAK